MTLDAGSTIGILGGGQLAQFLILAATKLGFKTAVFDPNQNSPAFKVSAKNFCSSFSNKSALKDFGNSCDVVTYEFENIPLSAIDIVRPYCEVLPKRNALEIGQNRILEKSFAEKLDIKTAEYSKVSNKKDLMNFLKEVSSKGIIKTITSGYDGKGQFLVEPHLINETIIKVLQHNECIVEKFQEFHSEVSIIAARGKSGSIITYEPGANVHKNGILSTTTVPTNLKKNTKIELVLAAGKILNKLDYIGVMGIEFFNTENGLIFNEFSPRVHNSGHWTLDGCMISQFEQHIRAITGLPLGETERHSNVVMKNIIGKRVNVNTINNHSIYDYGKLEVRYGRKMGHINIIKK